MSTYSWSVTAVEGEHMSVQYVCGDKEHTLNVPVPPVETDLAGWIDMYAPRAEWQRREAAAVQVGSSGTGSIALAGANSEAPQVRGSWNEEYLRALIYTIMEEIQDQTV